MISSCYQITSRTVFQKEAESATISYAKNPAVLVPVKIVIAFEHYLFCRQWSLTALGWQDFLGELDELQFAVFQFLP